MKELLLVLARSREETQESRKVSVVSVYLCYPQPFTACALDTRVRGMHLGVPRLFVDSVLIVQY
jgi:hypothetical protein